VSKTKRIQIYDTSLRDGTQGESVSLTVPDKLTIAERLDDIGIAYIEGGWPGSNPRDAEFFRLASALKLKQAKIAAFSSTLRPGKKPSEDANMKALVGSKAPVATIVAKTWDMTVREDLRIGLEANRKLIHDTIAYVRKRFETVILDAEHYFDGYEANPQYALSCLQTAAEAGADLVCLCDTRGGALPAAVEQAVTAAMAVGVDVGIHCHNDSGLAVANSMRAVGAGATQVQGTINGIGERCGNANLCTIIPNLQLKLGYRCMTARQLGRLAEVSRLVYELANLEPVKGQPYVGRSAFAHKGGLHVSAIRKKRETYEHIDPASVGNEQRVLVSDLSGRSNVEFKARQFGIDVEGRADELKHLLGELKQLENSGFQFEGAEASFELLMQRSLHNRLEFFKLKGFRVIDEKRVEGQATVSEATVMIEGPDGQVEHTAATGNGPVHALDRALRKALVEFYPQIEEVQLYDYKVRVLAGSDGTGSLVRVLIESGDSRSRWGTVGVSHNLVEASWQALVDSLVYKLHKDGVKHAKRACG